MTRCGTRHLIEILTREKTAIVPVPRKCEERTSTVQSRDCFLNGYTLSGRHISCSSVHKTEGILQLKDVHARTFALLSPQNTFDNFRV